MLTRRRHSRRTEWSCGALTGSGIRFLGPDGATAATHFTASDGRAARNLRADLRRIGALS